MEISPDTLSAYLKETQLLAYPVVLLAGLLASFTPCIYPLIPIVVGVIGAQSPSSRRRGLLLSALYVLGMATTFTILGGLASLSGMVFGQIQTNPISHLVVGCLIILFGFSTLDLLHLPLPANRGMAPQFLGPFGMGLLSGFVATPCITPILGTILLYVATKENPIFGMSLLFTFAIGLGTLLVLVGTFTTIALPRGGRWMVGIKHGFGYLMIGFGEYLLVRSAYLWAERGG
jgi:thiol:disulfide interchange protein DsbD